MCVCVCLVCVCVFRVFVCVCLTLVVEWKCPMTVQHKEGLQSSFHKNKKTPVPKTPSFPSFRCLARAENLVCVCVLVFWPCKCLCVLCV